MTKMRKKIEDLCRDFSGDPQGLRTELEKLRAEIRSEMRLETEGPQGEPDPFLGEELALVDRTLLKLDANPEDFHNSGPASL